jgi:hypothetical protein
MPGHRCFYFFALFLAVSTMSPRMTQPTDENNREDTSFFMEGEELLYEARWTGIKIGSIRLKTLSSIERSGERRRAVVAHIDSYSGLPFVDLHFTAYSEMDSAFNSLGSHSRESKDDGWQEVTYRYDLQKKLVVAEEIYRDDGEEESAAQGKIDTILLPRVPIQDGISLVYFARGLIRSQGSRSMPTLSYGQVGETYFRAERPASTISIGAWEKPIRVIQLSGKLKLKGIFGLTGDYIGWFSDDTAAVPIAAEMKVVLGSIKIELKQWKRSEWNPPG